MTSPAGLPPAGPPVGAPPAGATANGAGSVERARPRRRRRVLLVLVLVLLAVAGGAVVLVRGRAPSVPDDVSSGATAGSYPSAGESAALGVAGTLVRTLGTYDYAKGLDAALSDVSALTTGAYRTTYERNRPALAGAIRSSQQRSTARLLAPPALVAASTRAARVLVFVDDMVSARGMAASTQRYRVRVDLVRTSRTWLANDVVVSGAAGRVGSLPTASPSPGTRGDEGDAGLVGGKEVFPAGDSAEALGAAQAGAGRVASYDYRRLDQSKATALSVLTPALAQQYSRTFDGSVAPAVRQQMVVVTATLVGQPGLVDLKPDLAVVLVALRQEVQKGSAGRLEQSRLRLEMRRTGGRWLIDKITTL